MLTQNRKIANLRIYSRLKSLLLAISISTSLLSCSIEVKAQEEDSFYSKINISQNNENDVIEIPDIYLSEIKEILKVESCKISYKELDKLKAFNLNIIEGADLGWLKYCRNLERLNVVIADENDLANNNEQDVLGNLENLEELYIGTSSNISLTKENALFLKKFQH